MSNLLSLPPSVHMKPRWPPVPVSARSWRSNEKIGDWEQSRKSQHHVKTVVVVKAISVSCVLSFVDDVRVIISLLTDLHFDKIALGLPPQTLV